MTPYSYYPFPYYDRQNIAPQAPVSPASVAPIMPAVPMAPMQPMIPMQPMPMAPANTPVCPYTGLPVYTGPGNTNFMYGMEGMESMEDMEAMEDMMDMGTPNITRDPPPVLSNNPATTTITLFKELTAYPNYGNPSGNADILYTGNRGTWTFDIPSYLFVPGNLRGQMLIRAVLDDHATVPVNQYRARITINGTVVHNGPVPLEHGTPAGGRFNNWRTLTFNVSPLRRTTRVVIVNTSTAGPNDWIGLDWMELRLTPR